MISVNGATKLNLGAGSQGEPGYLNVDIVRQEGIDLVCDLDQFPWPFPSEHFDYIKAFDIFEHVDKPLEFMRECHRILKPGGELYIHTSYWKTENSFTDPTHKRFCTEQTFSFWVRGEPFNVRYGAAYAQGREFSYIDAPTVDGQELMVRLRRL